MSRATGVSNDSVSRYLGQSWICFCRHLKLAAPIGDQEVFFDWLAVAGQCETGTEAESAKDREPRRGKRKGRD